MPVDEVADKSRHHAATARSYETVAGFPLAHLQNIANTGERVEAGGWCFEVVDLDGRRIDKISASRTKMRPRIV